MGLSVLGLMALSAIPARAVIVYGDPGRLTTMPVLSGGVKPGWQFIGTYGEFTGIPIGPRAWVSAAHVSGGTGTLVYNNAGTSSSANYLSTRVATSGDLAVFELNADQPSFTEWAPVWDDTASLSSRILAGTLDVYMYGRGTDRGAAILNDSLETVGWDWVSRTNNEPLSYGTGNVFTIVNDSGNAYLFMPFYADSAESGIFSEGDSGGAVFAFDDVQGRWELVGINYAVQLVANAPNMPLREAAFFDARGRYYPDGNPPTWYEITGDEPVTLSSYSTSLPQKYSVLSPYIPVPEPSTMILATISAAGLIVAARRKSARG
jgi:hypothetical protein